MIQWDCMVQPHHSRGLSVKHEDQIETKGVICTALRHSSPPVS